ncbi:MAG: hypothetical protein V3T86_07620 [Planctomycetota bacterium]
MTNLGTTFKEALEAMDKDKILARHVVMVDADGRIVRPELHRRFTLFRGYECLEDPDAWVKSILGQAEEYCLEDPDHREVVVFAHGGLNTRKGALRRALELRPRMLADGKYPIFLNWHSSLISSYLASLFYVWQGRNNRYTTGLQKLVRRWILSWCVLAADFGRGLLRLPVVFFAQIGTSMGFFVDEPSKDAGKARKWFNQFFDNESMRAWEALARLKKGENMPRPGKDRRTSWEKFRRLFSYFLTLLIKVPSAVFIDGFGHSAWEVMLRRTKTAFRQDPGSALKCGRTDGGMAVFFKHLEEPSHELPITCIGHSMGTILLNQMLRGWPHLRLKNVVYMAAACTVRDAQGAMVSFLHDEHNKDCKTIFHNLVLHRKAEAGDWWGFRWFDPPIRGSLLVWIDNFLSNPHTPFDRTAGRFDNLLLTWNDIHELAAEKIRFRCFDAGDPARKDGQPQKHGDFTKRVFWNEEFWKPNKAPAE